jgi:uncharacterized protein (DUF433 family)
MDTPAVIRDPESGILVFRGTGVPFHALIECFNEGNSINRFLEDYPSVSREMAIAGLRQMRDALFADLGYKAA